MSRETKFRAWLNPRWDDDEDSNKMYYDIQNSYDNLGDVKPFDPMNSFANWLDNEVAIIEQYTGLKDKKGKEIYIGDILGTCCGKAEVYFDDELLMYRVKVRHGGTMPLVSKKSKRHFDYEVIGNVHENPDLLGDGE